MMGVGEKIDRLIELNVRIWHKDTLVRNRANIPLEEKAKLFLGARELNVQRAMVRDELDKLLGANMYSGKVRYYGTC